MDISDMWRQMRAEPSELPRAGAQVQTAGPGITQSITQHCRQVVPPVPNLRPNEVTVTITSHRPGAAGHVVIAVNLNTADGSYQGPTTTVGQGRFTATDTHVRATFVVLHPGWPVLGYGAVATWDDGTPHSVTLGYVELACDPLVWWSLPVRAVYSMSRMVDSLRRRPHSG